MIGREGTRSTSWADVTVRTGIFAVLAGILWGTAYPVIVWTLRSFSAYEIALGRAILATITTALVTRVGTGGIRLRRADFPVLMLLSLIGASAFWILMNFAVEYSSPNEASFLVATYPLFASLLAWPFLKERLSPAKAAGIVLGLVGAGLIFSAGSLTTLFTFAHLVGKVAALGASLAWSFYMVASRKLLTAQHLRPEYVTFNSFMLAIPVLVTVSLLFPKSSVTPLRLEAMLGLVWLGVFGSAIGFLLMNKALRQEGTATVSTQLMIFPLVTVLTSYLLLGQLPTVIQLVGGALVLLAVAMAQR